MIVLNKLKGLLKEKELSQEQLAKKMGITAQTLNAKLNEHRAFTVDEVKKICNILEIDNPQLYFF